ncbi:MAG: hypothetical protein EOO60_13875, partial [Hymenobacter sp.]
MIPLPTKSASGEQGEDRAKFRTLTTPRKNKAITHYGLNLGEGPATRPSPKFKPWSLRGSPFCWGLCPLFPRGKKGMVLSRLPTLFPHCPMPYAVLRVAKIKTQAHALSATGHNYRQAQYPHAIANADQEVPHPNREYVNHVQKDYWSLLGARIQEAGVKRIRSDSVRGMEVILTGSPEGFIRGQDGRAVDYS